MIPCITIPSEIGTISDGMVQGPSASVQIHGADVDRISHKLMVIRLFSICVLVCIVIIVTGCWRGPLRPLLKEHVHYYDKSEIKIGDTYRTKREMYAVLGPFVRPWRVGQLFLHTGVLNANMSIFNVAKNRKSTIIIPIGSTVTFTEMKALYNRPYNESFHWLADVTLVNSDNDLAGAVPGQKPTTINVVIGSDCYWRYSTVDDMPRQFNKYAFLPKGLSFDYFTQFIVSDDAVPTPHSSP